MPQVILNLKWGLANLCVLWQLKRTLEEVWEVAQVNMLVFGKPHTFTHSVIMHGTDELRETWARASLHTYLVLVLCFCAQPRIGGSLVLSGLDVNISHYQCAGKHRAMASSSSIARATRQPFRISFELSSLGFACARRYSLVSISRDQADLPQQMLFAWTDS